MSLFGFRSTLVLREGLLVVCVFFDESGQIGNQRVQFVVEVISIVEEGHPSFFPVRQVVLDVAQARFGWDDSSGNDISPGSDRTVREKKRSCIIDVVAHTDEYVDIPTLPIAQFSGLCFVRLPSVNQQLGQTAERAHGQRLKRRLDHVLQYGRPHRIAGLGGEERQRQNGGENDDGTERYSADE